jgi:hypothetical protein
MIVANNHVKNKMQYRKRYKTAANISRQSFNPAKLNPAKV